MPEYLSPKQRILGKGQRKVLAEGDGITINEACRLFPFPEKTLRNWCLKDDPFLGRPLWQDLKDTRGPLGQVFKDTLHVSKTDLEETVSIIKNPCNRPLPGNKGQWLAEGVYQDKEGLWFTARYLAQAFGHVVCDDCWHVWCSRPCLDLDPAKNDGLIRAQFVFWPKRYGLVRVFFGDQVHVIIERRTDTKKRERPAGRDGRWLSDEIYQDPQLDVCFTDRKATGLYDVTAITLSDWRRSRHPALDPKTNGGKLRYLVVPKLTWTRGVPTLFVSCQEDLQRIAAWRARRRLQARQVVIDQVPLATLCDQLGLKGKSERALLCLVLGKFRAEHPEGATQVEGWDSERNRPVDVWYYGRVTFERWLAGRKISELATEIRKRAWADAETRQREGPRLRRAVAFLQFVLTHGRDRPRLFERFLAEPPHGATLAPCKGVPSVDIKAWAKRARVGTKTLLRAKKVLDVKHFKEKRHGPMYWRLPGPVVFPALTPAVQASEPLASENERETAQLAGQPRVEPRRRRHRAEAKHLQWRAWKDEGLSYARIAIRHKDETGEEVTEDAVKKALKRLREGGQ